MDRLAARPRSRARRAARRPADRRPCDSPRRPPWSAGPAGGARRGARPRRPAKPGNRVTLAAGQVVEAGAAQPTVVPDEAAGLDHQRPARRGRPRAGAPRRRWRRCPAGRAPGAGRRSRRGATFASAALARRARLFYIPRRFPRAQARNLDGERWPTWRRRGPRAAGEEGTRRDFLYLLTGATTAVGAGARCLAADRQHEPVGRRAGAGLDRGRPVGHRGRHADHREVARQAGVHPPSHARRRSRRRAQVDARRAARTRSPTRTRVIEPEWLVMVGICTHLGCVPLGQRRRRSARRVRRLVLPLPRLASTTPPGGSAKGRRRATWWCRDYEFTSDDGDPRSADRRRPRSRQEER